MVGRYNYRYAVKVLVTFFVFQVFQARSKYFALLRLGDDEEETSLKMSS